MNGIRLIGTTAYGVLLLVLAMNIGQLIADNRDLRLSLELVRQGKATCDAELSKSRESIFEALNGQQEE